MARPTPENRPGVMERIAVGSVALGVAVMILSLAVVLGFKREVARKMEGFAAHVAVTDIRGVDALDSQPVHRNARLEELIRTTDGFVDMAPYAVKGGIVRTEEAVGEVILKGVEADYDWSLFEEWLVGGTLPRIGDSIRTKDILLSRFLADRLQLGVGERVEMLFVDGGERPRRDRFKIAGIYESGMEEMDRTMVITDIRNVQRLSGWREDEISGYEIRTRSLDEAEAFARTLGRTLLDGAKSVKLFGEEIAVRAEIENFKGLEVGNGIHRHGQGRGPALHAGKVHGVDEIARVQIAQQFCGTAQAHGNMVDHAFAYDEPFRQAPVFHTQFDLRFHMVAPHDEIPQPRGDDQGKQREKNGLNAAVTD